jgi:hypothetical protein
VKLLAPSTARRLVRGALVVSVLFAAFAIRVVTSSKKELEIGQRALAKGEHEAAVVHLRRAARWYAPGSPYHVRALRELSAIGTAAEGKGDGELALSAYRAVRAAIMSTRSFYVPERARLRAANERIADLMASQPPPPMDAGKSREALRAEHLALLSAEPGPSVFWTVVLLAGFLAWVSGAFLITTRAIDSEDRWVPREALRWGGVVVVGFGLFVLGMVLA